MLIVFCVKRPGEEGVPPRVGDRSIWLFQVCVRFEKFVEYLIDSNFANISVK